MTTDQASYSIIQSLLKSLLSQVWELSTPKNITYLWGFGRFLGIIITVQIVSGFLLAFYYVRGSEAWGSVVEITREVRFGWVIRLIHRNTASFVFLILFIHFVRGLVQASFYMLWPWLRGLVIMLLTMIAAFLGYVLPWGQISFWGATVIINLLSVLPIGKDIVTWLWGGFYVSAFTCRFFYAVHFLVPFVVLIIAGVHLILLHFTGRRVPGGLSISGALKIKFTHLFTIKDCVNLTIIWGMWLTLLIFPDWSADPVNFVVSDMSNSPLHIQPEWYFLHLYAILRSIPNKVGGLIGFGIALLLLSVLAFLISPQKISQIKSYTLIVWRFIFCNRVLMWLGIQPVEAPFIFIGQISSLIYFLYIGVCLRIDFYLAVLWNWRILGIANPPIFLL